MRGTWAGGERGTWNVNQQRRTTNSERLPLSPARVGKLGDVDDRAFVEPFADFVALIEGFHSKAQAPVTGLDQFRR